MRWTRRRVEAAGVGVRDLGGAAPMSVFEAVEAGELKPGGEAQIDYTEQAAPRCRR